jgi:glycosyltransferase involved in cell wall biosynthesis
MAGGTRTDSRSRPGARRTGASLAPRITFVAQRPSVPSFRLRLAPLAARLEYEGRASAEVVTLPRRPEWLRVWRLARAWSSADLLVFSKLKLLIGELGFVRRRCATWALDVDDAVMFGKPRRHGDAPDRAWWRRRRFARMVRRCSLVVAGSRPLADAIEPLGTPIEVWPTPVDLARYPVATLPEREVLRLGWIGLGANLRYLGDLAPVLHELAARRRPFELRVISDCLPDMPGIPLRLVPWSEAGEGEALAECDVGLAPLSDDPWTRGKGGYRCIQYAGAGLPSVATPVGAQRDVVADGVTGVLATTEQEWIDALERLASEADLRRRLGVAARARALERWDLATLAPRYVAWLLRLAGHTAEGTA